MSGYFDSGQIISLHRLGKACIGLSLLSIYPLPLVIANLSFFLSLSLSLSPSIFVSVNLIYVLTLLFLFRYVNECLTCLCIFLKNSSGSNSVFFSSMRNGNKIPWRRFWIVIQSYLGAIGSNSSKACGRFPIVFYFYRCSEIMTLLKKYKLVYHRK